MTQDSEALREELRVWFYCPCMRLQEAYTSTVSATPQDYYYHDLPNGVHHCLSELAGDPSNLLMILSGQAKTRRSRCARTRSRATRRMRFLRCRTKR